MPSDFFDEPLATRLSCLSSFSIKSALLLIIVFGKIGGIHGLIDALPQSYLTFKTEHFNRYLFLMVPLMLPTLSPHHVQRLLMTNNYRQGKKAYYNLSWIYFVVAMIGFFLGLSAKVLFPVLPKADQALFALITNYLPVGIFGIAIIGILAVLMSSVDSDLNTSSIILVNDIIIPYNKHIKKKELSEAEKLKYARNASIFVGICATIFANKCSNLFEIGILMRTLWFSVILSPLYFLVFNMKISIKGLLASVVIGLITFFCWNTYLKPITKIDGIFPGFFANAITVFSFYILGGRQKIFSENQLKAIHQREAAQIKQQLSIRDLQMRNNIFLGLCLVFLQLIPLIFEAGSLTYSKLILTLINGTMAIMLIFGGSLELFAEEKRFQWLKLTTLFFCLPVSSTYLLLTSQENGLHILTLVLSFVVMLLSIEEKYEKKIIITCCLAIFTILLFYQKNNCILYWPETFSWQHSSYVFGYVAILFLLRSCSKTVRK